MAKEKVDHQAQTILWRKVMAGEPGAVQVWNDYCKAAGVELRRPIPEPVNGPPYYPKYPNIVPVDPKAWYLRPENQFIYAPPGFDFAAPWERAGFGNMLGQVIGCVANFHIFKATWTPQEMANAGVKIVGGTLCLVGPWGRYANGTGHHDSSNGTLYRHMGAGNLGSAFERAIRAEVSAKYRRQK